MTQLDTVSDSHDTARNRDLAVPHRHAAMPAVLDLVTDEIAALGGPTTTEGRIAASVPANTRRIIERVFREFTAWCKQLDRPTLPSDGATVADYLNHRCNAGLRDSRGRPVGGMLSPDALRQQLFAIRRVHRAAGYRGQPDTEDALAVIRQHAQQWAENGKRDGHAPPLVAEDLRACLETIPSDTFTGIRNRGLLVLGFAGFLRRSELAGLHLSDVERTEQGLTLHIRRAKTGLGQSVDVVRGKSRETDPVRAFTALADAVRDHRELASDHLFWRRDFWGNLPAPITAQSISNIVGAAAVDADLLDAENYSGHSLRAGGATTAYAAGVPIETIRRHGRWAHGSTAMFRYFRSVDRWRDNASGGLGL